MRECTTLGLSREFDKSFQSCLLIERHFAFGVMVGQHGGALLQTSLPHHIRPGQMMSSGHMRLNADNCSELAASATTEPERRRYQRMANAWRDLAKCQDWLDGRSPAEEPGSIKAPPLA